jgi:hypothetical protein
MSREVVSARDLEHGSDGVFSAYTHPKLERFVESVITKYRSIFPNRGAEKLFREFVLYGLLKASGYSFRRFVSSDGFVLEPDQDKGAFCTNNGILAVSDFNGEVYIRGGDSYHGFLGDCDLFPDLKIMGMEGTLLRFGYRKRCIYVPHSNNEDYTDKNMEQMFRMLHRFSLKTRKLRGEATSGFIVKDLSEPDPPAPYPCRDYSLPRIEMSNGLIVGNRAKTIVIGHD